MIKAITLVVLISTTLGNEHQPFNWTITRWDDWKLLRSTFTAGAPTLTIPVLELFGPALVYKGPPEGKEEAQADTEITDTYWCPSSNPGKRYCDYPGHYYCGYWGCETIVTGGWTPQHPDKFLKVEWGPEKCKRPVHDFAGGIINRGTCTHLRVIILLPHDIGWLVGRTWGVRLWEKGTDRGTLILIKKEETKQTTAIGPNVVLTNRLKSMLC